MEDFYNRNKYLSIEKRQMLANQLAIPEQCVSDYFKNLRSRKKHEERMKCLLKGLECGDKQLDKIDCEAESSSENGLDNQLPSCSRTLPVVTSASARESPLPVQPPSLIRQCGRRYNVAPAMTVSTFQSLPAKNVSETDLVASKIAALTQCQKSPHKAPASENGQVTTKTSADVYQVRMIPSIPLGHQTVQENSRHETNCLQSQTSSSGTEAVETFSFDSLIDGSMMSPEAAVLEDGQQLYVVHVNHLETSVHH